MEHQNVKKTLVLKAFQLPMEQPWSNYGAPECQENGSFQSIPAPYGATMERQIVKKPLGFKAIRLAMEQLWSNYGAPECQENVGCSSSLWSNYGAPECKENVGF